MFRRVTTTWLFALAIGIAGCGGGGSDVPVATTDGLTSGSTPVSPVEPTTPAATTTIAPVQPTGPSGTVTVAPAQPGAVAEFKDDVVVVSEADAARYSRPSADRTLTYTGSTPPAENAVVVWNGEAYKIRSLTQEGAATYKLATATPDFQEVFKTLIISTEFDVEPKSFRIDKVAEPSRFSSTLPNANLTVTPNLGPAVVRVNGTLTNARAKAQFAYTLKDGFTSADISLTGDLEFTTTFGVKATTSGDTGRAQFALPGLRVPIPVTLGTVDFVVDFGVFAAAQSQIEVTLGNWQRRQALVARAAYSPGAGWQNLSSLTGLETAQAAPRSAFEAAMAGLTLRQATTVGSLRVGLFVKPALSAMKGSVGVAAVRIDVSARAAAELTGTFPTLVDCLRVPITGVLDVYALVNYLTYESLLDFEGDLQTATFKLFTASTPLWDPLTFGNCGGSLTIVADLPGVVTPRGIAVPFHSVFRGGSAPSSTNWFFFWSFSSGEAKPTAYFQEPGDQFVQLTIIEKNQDGSRGTRTFSGSTVVRLSGAGRYTGTFTGTDAGSFDVDISEDGNITGSGYSQDLDARFAVSGTLSVNGLLVMTLGDVNTGASFSGRMLPGTDNWIVQGTWLNPLYGDGGTFSGARAP